MPNKELVDAFAKFLEEYGQDPEGVMTCPHGCKGMCKRIGDKTGEYLKCPVYTAVVQIGRRRFSNE